MFEKNKLYDEPEIRTTATIKEKLPIYLKRNGNTIAIGINPEYLKGKVYVVPIKQVLRIIKGKMRFIYPPKCKTKAEMQEMEMKLYKRVENVKENQN